MTRSETREPILAERSEQREILEEVVRLLESARTLRAEEWDFDDARLDGHLVTALTSARSALSIATGRGTGAHPHEPER